MDDKQLDLRTRIAQAIVPLCELLEEIMGAAPQATVDPPKDIDYERLGESLTLDYGRLGDSIELDGVAEHVLGNLDMYDLAQNIDAGDIASEMDCEAIASCLDHQEVAAGVDIQEVAEHFDLDGYLPSVEEFVANVMADEDYVEAIAEAVAAHVVKRLAPQAETETETETEKTDEHKPVNLSLDPVADSDNNTGN